MRQKVSVRVSLPGILRQIRFDTLRRVHNVGFLLKRLKCLIILQWLGQCYIYLNAFLIRLIW